ncbi:hypothetical protein BC830DRAFT_99706 [Chytriomyces sp. MP71]|nr:hypothetical protein BC830DRAFT_99706 [Chytriomyces sp. MP71]
MTSPPPAGPVPPSLVDLCLAKLNRNVHSLNTNLGDVPQHLLLKFLPKFMSFKQLEHLREYNPHIEDELSSDFNGLYRGAALRDFASLRRASESSDWREPELWRDAYMSARQEREEQLLRVKQKMSATNKAIEKEKAANRIRILDAHAPIRKASWTANHSLKPKNKHFEAVKKEVVKQRPFNPSILRPSLSSLTLDKFGSLSPKSGPPSSRRIEQHPATMKTPQTLSRTSQTKTSIPVRKSTFASKFLVPRVIE